MLLLLLIHVLPSKFHGPKASEEKNHQLGLILKEISEKNLRTPQLDEFLKSDEINISASRVCFFLASIT